MEESQNTGTVTKDDSFQILQKVEDMIDYAYPLIKRWSVADKYAIGNDLISCHKSPVGKRIYQRYLRLYSWKGFTCCHAKTAVLDKIRRT